MGVLASPAAAGPLPSESEATRRLAGVDRIATAVSLAQAAWPSGAATVQRFAASDARCQLAMMHHPPFSSGTAHGSTPQLRGLLQTLRDGGVDVVLASHAHSYERLRRVTPGGAADPDAGFRSFVVGTGGKDLRPFAPPAQPLTVTRTRRYFGVLDLELRPASYRWEFQRLADSGHGGGRYTDTGFGTCG